ncbi:MAG TPA: SH3 domain-containing protein, partial [Bryobacteraceae bacterium]|nr:SH3 domain-containing protein [Bryobacteraceae bacterium]
MSAAAHGSVSRMSSRTVLWLPVAALTAISCSSVAPPSQPAIGQAYAGPATLRIRKEIDPKSATVATVHFGESLDIVGRKRSWYMVRTKSGAVGWTDDRALLDPAQMARLRVLARETAGLPSQGAAKAFDALNVHTEPNRLSPSFAQLKTGEVFEVIAHRMEARKPPPKRELIPPLPRPEKIAKKKRGFFQPPPPPAAPALPADWEKLSLERQAPADPDAAPVRYDDWTLIRSLGGQSGWVLTSALYMLIPDEVAQYAEGHRITSYFSLGKIQDGDLKKDIWLWTTSEKLGEDHDFDSYRVFVWSLRRHRYETAYIQRREIGFFPVLAKTGEFSVCLQDD